MFIIVIIIIIIITIIIIIIIITVFSQLDAPGVYFKIGLVDPAFI